MTKKLTSLPLTHSLTRLLTRLIDEEKKLIQDMSCGGKAGRKFLHRFDIFGPSSCFFWHIKLNTIFLLNLKIPKLVRERSFLRMIYAHVLDDHTAPQHCISLIIPTKIDEWNVRKLLNWKSRASGDSFWSVKIIIIDCSRC